jgi:hypothetical protein
VGERLGERAQEIGGGRSHHSGAPRMVPQALRGRMGAGAGVLWLVFAATLATQLSGCLAGRVTQATPRAPLQLRVTRQAQEEDEHGQLCGKVFVAANRVMTQEQLDSLVVSPQCPQLLFTDVALKAQFEAWRGGSWMENGEIDPVGRDRIGRWCC